MFIDIKLQNEADLQTSLMPQELNPAFVADKNEPWRAIMPVARLRRGVEALAPAPTSFMTQLQRYSRITACAVLALAAIVEIILYVLDYLT
ncbi:hypothetical protein ABMA27_010220 [Loxostege sticticalis]|uniref:Uncharacterized protein n=1 Tax=Loxostege sticticalis TaxID=481309 RepID=A0ABR3H529_LOXSC